MPEWRQFNNLFLALRNGLLKRRSISQCRQFKNRFLAPRRRLLKRPQMS